MPRAGLSPEIVTRTAADLADRDGLASVTLSTVARRLGVRPASLYSHVAGADDLLQRITLLALTELAEAMAPALSGRAGADALAALAQTFRDYAREHPGRYAASRRRLDHPIAVQSAGPRLAELMTAVLRGYAIDGDLGVHAVRVVSSTIHGFLDLEASGAFDHSRPPAADSWGVMVTALDRLLVGWSV